MTSGFLNGNFFQGLAFRVLFFLSLALLPIGMLAISQTQQLTNQYRENAELSLISITEQASTGERDVLQAAFSAGQALASTISLFWNEDDSCSAFLRAYRQSNPGYALVGFIEKSGLMRCSSAETVHDFSQEPMLQIAIDEPRLRVQTLSAGAATRRPVTNVTVPVIHDDALHGFITLSIPSSTFDRNKNLDLTHKPLALKTFNAEGDIITAKGGDGIDSVEVPKDVALQLLTDNQSAIFEAHNQEDVQRIYVVREILPDTVFALSVWPADTPLLNPSFITQLGTQLPIVMWLASLIVAFWALNRLAISNIRKLSRQMRRFALNRNLPSAPLGSSVPAELVEMQTAFINMGESILRDEATLEDSLREKNILLKEVHHRVKNNLQLISSIMNMQIRQAKSKDASRVLKRLQDRILSLATVHKNLYQTDNLVRVDAAVLLREVVNQALAVGLAPGSNVEVVQDYSSISLEADDAAPLTLLVSEAMTNTLKHVVQEGDPNASISVSLKTQEPNLAVLTIVNTTGGIPEEEGTGLGSRLIDAFARQLNGQVESAQQGDLYRLSVSFPVPQNEKQIYDY